MTMMKMMMMTKAIVSCGGETDTCFAAAAAVLFHIVPSFPSIHVGNTKVRMMKMMTVVVMMMMVRHRHRHSHDHVRSDDWVTGAVNDDS